MGKENDNTDSAIKTKLNSCAKAALILFYIAAVLALLSIYLLVTAESVKNEGESGGITAIVFGGVTFLLILPASGITAFIGCIIGIISLCRTSYKQGRIVLILNFLLCSSCGVYLWAFYSVK